MGGRKEKMHHIQSNYINIELNKLGQYKVTYLFRKLGEYESALESICQEIEHLNFNLE